MELRGKHPPGSALALHRLRHGMVDLEHVEARQQVGAAEGEGVEARPQNDVLARALRDGGFEAVLGVARAAERDRTVHQLHDQRQRRRLIGIGRGEVRRDHGQHRRQIPVELRVFFLGIEAVGDEVVKDFGQIVGGVISAGVSRDEGGDPRLSLLHEFLRNPFDGDSIS